MRALLQPALALAAAALAACGPSAPSEDRLDEVVVGGGPTETLTVENDAQGQLPSIEEELSGRLPSSFPEDVPLPGPATVTDLGERYVEISLARDMEDVRADVDARLRGAGWAAVRGGAYTKADRRLEVTISGDRIGTIVGYSY